jgi:hypothetical protein
MEIATIESFCFGFSDTVLLDSLNKVVFISYMSLEIGVQIIAWYIIINIIHNTFV